jgi:transcriptional regulator with XRE-family HTH domain
MKGVICEVQEKSEVSAQEWSVLLDEIKLKLALSSDAKLAEALSVSRGYICSIRKGRKSVSPDLANLIFAVLAKPDDYSFFGQREILPQSIKILPKGARTRSLAICRAGGHCELCDIPAPFMDSYGNPYLEVRVLVPYKDGGSHGVDNLAALCPNCSRRVEICPTLEDKMRLKSLHDLYSSQITILNKG